MSVLGQALPQPNPWIDVIRDLLVAGFQPLRILLFGSYARGQARPDSDIDFLVVLPRVDNKREAAVAMLSALRDLPVAKDILVTTPEEIAERGQVVGTTLRSALAEGKSIYERG
jgi:predicted nucleotidyltransferase